MRHNRILLAITSLLELSIARPPSGQRTIRHTVVNFLEPQLRQAPYNHLHSDVDDLSDKLRRLWRPLAGTELELSFRHARDDTSSGSEHGSLSGGSSTLVDETATILDKEASLPRKKYAGFMHTSEDERKRWRETWEPLGFEVLESDFDSLYTIHDISNFKVLGYRSGDRMALKDEFTLDIPHLERAWRESVPIEEASRPGLRTVYMRPSEKEEPEILYIYPGKLDDFIPSADNDLYTKLVFPGMVGKDQNKCLQDIYFRCAKEQVPPQQFAGRGGGTSPATFEETFLRRLLPGALGYSLIGTDFSKLRKLPGNLLDEFGQAAAETETNSMGKNAQFEPAWYKEKVPQLLLYERSQKSVDMDSPVSLRDAQFGLIIDRNHFDITGNDVSLAQRYVEQIHDNEANAYFDIHLRYPTTGNRKELPTDRFLSAEHYLDEHNRDKHDPGKRYQDESLPSRLILVRRVGFLATRNRGRNSAFQKPRWGITDEALLVGDTLAIKWSLLRKENAVSGDGSARPNDPKKTSSATGADPDAVRKYWGILKDMIVPEFNIPQTELRTLFIEADGGPPPWSNLDTMSPKQNGWAVVDIDFETVDGEDPGPYEDHLETKLKYRGLEPGGFAARYGIGEEIVNEILEFVKGVSRLDIVQPQVLKNVQIAFERDPLYLGQKLEYSLEIRFEYGGNDSDSDDDASSVGADKTVVPSSVHSRASW